MSEAFLLADHLFSPWFIIAAGVIAVLCCLYLVLHNRERGALIMLWGCFNFTGIYLWIYVAQPPFVQRALAVRTAIIFVLLSVVFYTARRAHFFTSIRAKRPGERG